MKTLNKNQLIISHNIIIFIYALLFGGLYASYLIGNKLNPSDIDWLLASRDPAQHFLGWVFFRNDSWHWPLTFTQDLLYPTGTSIAYTDSIPLFAIVFKLFSPVLPARFQYFGLYIFLSFILQFFWGAKLGQLFSRNSLFCATASGLLFMLAPPLNLRVHGHIALTSHWLILASIWSYFRLSNDFKNLSKILLFQSLLIIISSGIHPYIAAMVLFLSITSYINLFISKKIKIIKLVLFTILAITLLLLGWYFFGYFSSNSSIGGSYGLYSLNLSSLINPQSFSSILKPIAIKEGQGEGFNYLGIGVIILLLTNIKYLSNNFRSWATNKNFLCLFTLSILLTIFALSNKVYLGEIKIITYNIPAKLYELFEVFRASGRFFWPVHYLILLGSIVSTLKFWNRVQVRIILTLIIFIQFIDLTPLHKTTTNWIHNYNSSEPLLSQEWNSLSENYNKLIILPSDLCGNSPAYFPVFEKLAAFQKLSINSFYLARYNKSDFEIQCQQLPQEVRAGRLELDAAYILDKKKFFSTIREINNSNSNSLYCSEIDGYILCAKNLDLSSESQVPKITASPYSIDQVLNFNNTENNSLDYQFGDWSGSGDSGTWTDGEEAHIFLKIKEEILNDLILKVEAEPFINKKHPQQVVEILINDQLVDKWIFNYGEKYGEIQSKISQDLIKYNDPLLITFKFLNLKSPASLGLSDDNRLVGLQFKKLQLVKNKFDF